MPGCLKLVYPDYRVAVSAVCATPVDRRPAHIATAAKPWSRQMKHPAVGLVLLSALVGVPIRAQDTPLPIDPHADLTDLYRLMYPLTGKAGQTSSYDRNGGNADASFWYYLRGQPKRTVMADLRGPGVVSRIWVTAFDASAARIEIFVDGNSVPVISAFMRDFFGNGTLPPFLPPVSTYSTGSWVSYVPIPYHKSCRIEAVNARQDNNAIYYNITYRTLPPGEPMPPAFQMPPNGHQQNHLNLLTSQWNNRGQDPKTPQPGQQTLSGAPALPAQSTITLASLSGAGIRWTLTGSHPYGCAVDSTARRSTRSMRRWASSSSLVSDRRMPRACRSG
jgi:hypothetical protein